MVKSGSDTMQHEGLSIASKGILELFVADSNESLQFRLIRDESELKKALSEENSDDEKAFAPEMSHQIYGDKEHVFGYRGLKIDLWMSAASLKAYARMNADETITLSQSEGVKPDLVLPPLVKILAEGQVTESIDAFTTEIQSDRETKFKPQGEKITEFEIHDTKDEGKARTYEIYYCDINAPGFKDYHKRLQPWIMFYIDAASYIDDDDDNWRFFLLFERYVASDGQTHYAVAGYTTVYQYYAYPEHMRPRISQMLVLPPFQRQGLGAKLLDTVSKYYWNNPKVVDITVEDPSDDFIRLRDFVDVQNSLKLLECFSSLDKVKTGFNDSMIKEANDKLKMCKRQTRRVYEIVRLHWAKKSGPLSDDSSEFKAYRIDIKKRLNIPFQKEANQLEKLKKALNAEEFAAATINITNREQRLENLQNQFNELTDHYKQILERVSVS